MKKVDLEELILKLLQDKPEVKSHEVAQAVGFSKSNEADRKSIQRAFNALIQRGIVQARGTARARVYIRVPQNQPPSNEFAESCGMILSPESERLLKYVSQPPTVRIPVGYNQKFLESYKPNRTFYLSQAERSELLKEGKVENKERPAGTYARTILNRLLIDLSWNSSRLEGNTYSLLETMRLIEFGESATGKNTTEAQMILNHKEAIEYIVGSTETGKISTHEVCSIHALLSDNLLGDPAASGRLRRLVVSIGGSTYLPLENPHRIDEYFQTLIDKLNLIEDPFEQSFFALVHLSYLQAFEDVNKRTSRLVANIPLIKKNLKPLSFIDVNPEAYVQSLIGIYEKNDISLFRDLYLWAYKRSSQRYSAIQQGMGEPHPLKLKYRTDIQEIVRTVILEQVPGPRVVSKIQTLLEALKKARNLSEIDIQELFQLIEIELISLHDGNIARFRLRPSEFQAWKEHQRTLKPKKRN